MAANGGRNRLPPRMLRVLSLPTSATASDGLMTVELAAALQVNSGSLNNLAINCKAALSLPSLNKPQLLTAGPSYLAVYPSARTNRSLSYEHRRRGARQGRWQ